MCSNLASLIDLPGGCFYMGSNRGLFKEVRGHQLISYAAKRGSQMGGPKEEAEPDDAAKGVRGWRGWWERLPIQAIPPPPASLTERLSHSGHQIHSEDKKRNVHSESSGWSSETEPMKGSLRIQGLSRRIWRHSSSSIAQPPRSRQLPIARGVKAAGHYVGNKQITSFPSIHNVCKNRQKIYFLQNPKIAKKMSNK